MISHLYHLQINIRYENIFFYKELMHTLGWSVIFEKEGDVIGFRSGRNGDLWFVTADKNEPTDYDKIGVNHVAFRVETMDDVGGIDRFLQKHGIPPLFNTPRHRPEFAQKEDDTYYQVIFESPDGIQFEIVYIGPKPSN